MRVSSLVEQILNDNQPIKFEGREVHPRNSDKALIVRIWAKQGLLLDQWQIQKFFSVASPETIRRIRQKFQEKGQYKADNNVAKERRFKSYRMQQITPKAKPNYIEQTLL